MATFFELVERLINAVYSTPNPQVRTYFRDLRIAPKPPVDEDDDSLYRYEPEPKVEPAVPLAGAKNPRSRNVESATALAGRR